MRGRALAVARWAAVAVPVVDVALVLGGVLDVGAAVSVGVVLELLLVAVVVAEVAAFRSGYRRARHAGQTGWDAGMTALGVALPRPLAWVLRSELGLARALWWALRRRRAVRAGDVVLTYTDRIAVMLWTTVGVGVVETAVVHLVVGLPWLRWTLLAVSVYGLLWLVALAFSLRQHPHVVRDGQLLLRFGHFRETRVPLEHLARARVHVRTGHPRNVVLDGDGLALTVAGETDVELAFTEPVEVEVRGAAHAVGTLDFFADDPRVAVRALSAARRPDAQR